MGLSIHYSGKLKSKDLLNNLIEEVENFCEAYEWEHHVFEREFPDSVFGKTEFTGNLYGIIFNPPGCETVSFAFLSNGKVCTPAMLLFYAESGDKSLEELITGVHVKTEYAGIEIHSLLIRFFKYSAPKYLNDFKMTDEGGFWETKDERTLLKQFKSYDEVMDKFNYALQNCPKFEDEKFGDYLKRVMGSDYEKLKKPPANEL
ncbi:MAG: hypothetical protein IAF38_03315 [Bacteroidia bacterium]|nr:hypothetical protein [Bacteroidia bacterium]